MSRKNLRRKIKKAVKYAALITMFTVAYIGILFFAIFFPNVSDTLWSIVLYVATALFLTNEVLNAVRRRKRHSRHKRHHA